MTSLTCHQLNSCKDCEHTDFCWMFWCTTLWGRVCWAASRKPILQPADLTSQCNGQLEVTSMWIVYLQASKTPVTKKKSPASPQLVHNNLQKVFCEIRWAVHTCRPCRQESELLEVIQAFNWLRRIEVAGGTCLYQISVHCAEIKKPQRSYRRNTNRLLSSASYLENYRVNYGGFNAAPSGEQRERKRKLAPVSNSKGNTQFYFEEDYIILTDPHTSLTSSSLCINVLFSLGPFLL